MTTMEKVSATLERDVVDEIRRRVGPRQVSAFLNEAARQKLQQSRIQDYLRELYAEHGSPDAATRREAKKRIASVIES
jgi:hypothetical protein